MSDMNPQALTSGLAQARRHIFSISYGRTGSTLFMALLSNHPGVLVRGENHMMIRRLQGVYDGLREKHFADASLTSNSWFGAHLFEDSFLLPVFREFIEKILAGDRSLDGVRVLGFKEVRYNGRVSPSDKMDPDEAPRHDDAIVARDLDFLRKLFPGCLFVFNTREPTEVIRSDFQIGGRAERFAALNQLYKDLAAAYDGLVVDYADVAEFGPQTQAVFERLGIEPDTKIISDTLSRQQGYATVRLGSKVSRVPYYVKVLEHEGLAFLDVQSITLFKGGIAVITGGILSDLPIAISDWQVHAPGSRIVNFRDSIHSPHYKAAVDHPRADACGFALEVFLPGELKSLDVDLFGKPALLLQHATSLPIRQASI